MTSGTPLPPTVLRRRRLFILAGASMLAALAVGTVMAGIAISHLSAAQGNAAGASSKEPASAATPPSSMCP